MAIRTAGLIIIGNEILSGRVKDENIYFLCTRFRELGVRVEKIAIVGDEVEDIREEVRGFAEAVDIVVTCGGVGPTPDDVTYEAVAAAFALPLVLNNELSLYWENDPSENAESINKMSTVPESSNILYTELPETEKMPVVVVSNVYMFPGTPKLLQSRFIGLENRHFKGNGIKFHKREIFLCIDESLAVSALNKTVKKYPVVDIGSYPEINNHHYRARITLCSHELDAITNAYDMLVSLLDSSWVLDESTFVRKNKL